MTKRTQSSYFRIGVADHLEILVVVIELTEHTAHGVDVGRVVETVMVW